MELWITKGASTAIIFAFFGAVVWFLRFLYGPKGKFRDPVWDEWNEKARLDLEKKLDGQADASLRSAFIKYAKGFFSGDAEADRHLQLKVDHSLRVFANAEALAAVEAALSPRLISRSLKLAALFHDAGRFEQYKCFHTFADAASCNHGALGVRVIRKQKFLRNEEEAVRRLALFAVSAHNRLDMPKGLSGAPYFVLAALRDADKLDILKVMTGYLGPEGRADGVVLLHLADEPGLYSPSVLEALENRRVALYSDMRYYNDFRILLCSWLYDLHFPTSFRMVRQEGYLDQVIAGLSGIPEVKARVERLARELLCDRSAIPSAPVAGAGNSASGSSPA